MWTDEAYTWQALATSCASTIVAADSSRRQTRAVPWKKEMQMVFSSPFSGPVSESAEMY